MADNQEYQQLALDAGRAFTPGAPINEKDLFAGRIEQVRQVVDAVSHRGQHAVIYGERGVGKTSLANVISDFLVGAGRSVLAPRVNCDSHDDYNTLWRKVFSSIEISRESRGIGFQSEPLKQTASVLEGLPEKIAPDDVRRMLTLLAQGVLLIVIFDEFDRLPNGQLPRLMADTITTLSDHAVPATMVLVGVADSVDELIAEHQSVERALVQIPMPRMSEEELRQIIQNGLARLNMDAEEGMGERISSLSQGLPYYTHLLSLYAAREALDNGTKTIAAVHLDSAINMALEKSQQSIRNAYYMATKSPRKDSLYKQVFLACALSTTDEFSYFAAAAVRDPMSAIMKRPYDIPSFAKHLNEFCDQKRGAVLEKSGEKHRYRFRFTNPLMQPFVVMHGLANGLISQELLDELARRKPHS